MKKHSRQCACDRKAYEEEQRYFKEKEHRELVSRNTRSCFEESRMEEWTFENADMSDAVMNRAKSYVENWSEMKRNHIESDFFIDSAGTSNEEHGNPVHRGTQKKLRKEGIPCGNHRARKMCREEYAAFDYIICMERYNIQNIMRIIGNDPEHKVQRLLDYTNRPRDIADPWYTGNFDETFDDVMEGCQAFLSYLMEHLQ